MLTPSRARQEERINVRVFLPLRLECNNFRLVRTITVRGEFFDLFEAFCTRLSAAVATHPGACEYRGGEEEEAGVERTVEEEARSGR